MSSREPNISEYAPVTHCSWVVEACRSRPMVGRAMVRTVLSTISTKKQRHRAANGSQAWLIVLPTIVAGALSREGEVTGSKVVWDMA